MLGPIFIFFFFFFFAYFFPENRFSPTAPHIIVFIGDYLHEMSVFSGKVRKEVQNYHLLKFLPSMLNLNKAFTI